MKNRQSGIEHGKIFCQYSLPLKNRKKCKFYGCCLFLRATVATAAIATIPMDAATTYGPAAGNALGDWVASDFGAIEDVIDGVVIGVPVVVITIEVFPDDGPYDCVPWKFAFTVYSPAACAIHGK